MISKYLNFKALRYITLIAFFSLSQLAFSQKNRSYPENFTISAKEYNQLFTIKTSGKIKSKNKFLDKSIVVINQTVGENRQLKLKLHYFKNADLIVQENSTHSKIIFILSSDDSIFYNSKQSNGDFILTKCSKDDIVSE